jgi:hypothetical protein
MAGKGKNVRMKRPRKSGNARRRREKTHIKRLLGLGIPETRLKLMSAAKRRKLLLAMAPQEKKTVI